VAGAVDVDQVAHDWLSTRSKGRIGDAARAARGWLRGKAIDLAGPLAPIIPAIRTDGYLVGAHAAAQILNVTPPDWSSWTPGDTAAAERVLGADGLGEGLRRMLADADITITSVAESRFADLARALADGLAAGDTPDALARTLRDVLDRPGWAATVAVTETTRAVSAATLDRYEAAGVTASTWVVAPDQRVCPLCEANAADGPTPLGAAFTSGAAHPPQHPHCFPAGVVVTGPSAVAATARRYEGDLVTIVFTDGEEVPVTPNHPVLTPDGWVSAGDLHEGADVLRALDADAVTRSVCPDDRQAVARIEDVAAAFGETGPVSAVLVPVAPEDFHGDGAGDDEVEVVRALRHAQLHRVPELGEHGGEGGLLLAERASALALGDEDALCACHRASAAGLVRGGEHLASLVGGGALPAERHCGGSGPAVDAHLVELPVDDVPADAVPRCERLDGLTAEVVLSEVRRDGLDAPAGAPRVGSSPQRFLDADQVLAEGLAADAGEGRALADRLAGSVEVHRVAELRRVGGWSGHVFNLETVEGWYFANGIIAHNCRCALMPSIT
jgi:SPP1 gp7 family putative phage head morphogenesis protein